MNSRNWRFAETDNTPGMRWPVPADVLDDVMRAPISLDRLVEYADEYSDTYDSDGFSSGIAKLAYMVAIDELDDHLYEHAEYHLRLGLRHAPDNLSLRSHHGLALWGLRRRDEAVEEMLAAITLCRRAGKIAPMLWLLTARALDEIDRPEDALPLLEELTALLPPEENFWELLAVVRERAERV